MAGRSAIGLDIGTSGVRAAELSFGKGQVTLEKFGQVALPEGAVRDGEVVDPDAVAAAIKQLWAHTKFSSKKVVIGVANQKVIVRQVDLPWMPADELKKSLAFQVQDFVPCRSTRRCSTSTRWRSSPPRAAAASCAACSSPRRATWCNASLEAVQKAGLCRRSWSTSPRSRCSARSPTPTTWAWAPRSRHSSTSVPASPTSSSTRAASRASSASC